MGDSLTIDFYSAELSHNNLGGYGPDTGDENLRFAGVATTDDGRTLDLVVTADSGYEPSNTAMNKINGLFAQAHPPSTHHPDAISLSPTPPPRNPLSPTFLLSARRRST